MTIQIYTWFENPPAYLPNHRFGAVMEGDEGEGPYGFGATANDAVTNLTDQLEYLPEYEIVEK